MKKLEAVFILTLLQLFNCNSEVQNSTTVTHHLDVIYWEVKPFIFTNEDGNLDGIIPQMFEEANYYCGNATKKIARFVQKMPSRKSFADLLQSDVEYGFGSLENVSTTKAFWAPIVSRKGKRNATFEKGRNLISYQLVKSSEIVLIVPRYHISLPTKILRGIISCQAIFLIAFLLSALLSMIIWLLEHFENDSFSNSFIKGTGIGLWWSIVSMTTVGYGDVVPKSVLGRLVAVIWLIVGMLVSCIMTATMTDVVSGVGNLQVRGKSISVLENSFEETSAGTEYGANVTPVESYSMVLQLIREGKVFGGMMSADVAAWYQNEIVNDDEDVPLRIVNVLPSTLYMNCYVYKNIHPDLDAMFKCMFKQKEEVYLRSIEKYHKYCDTEKLYIGSIQELFVSSRFVHVLAIVVSGLFVIGIGYELFDCLRKNGLHGLLMTCKKIICRQQQQKENGEEVQMISRPRL